MKKIGIFTHYFRSKNIGGLLQAYALVQILNQYGYCAEQISFDYRSLNWKIKCRRCLFGLDKRSLKRSFSVFLKLFRCNSSKENQDIAAYKDKQNQLFLEFEQTILHSSQIYTSSNIATANSKYDVFISGSDQVWVTALLVLNAFWGEFAVSDKKVISYAASSNVKQFPPLAEKVFIKKLARLNAISVREKTLKDYIERITPYKATIVLDPTFLLSPQDWLKIANPVSVPHKPYIFCYFLGGKSAWQRQKAQAYADKYGYEVIHLPYIRQKFRFADNFLKGEGKYDVGPREFVALLDGAQCVFTDSFHGTALSINFGKNFYVFNRDDKSGLQSMNARITDILDTLGLVSRHITDKDTALDNVPLDFTHAHEVLSREKQFSINWLLNALKE